MGNYVTGTESKDYYDHLPATKLETHFDWRICAFPLLYSFMVFQTHNPGVFQFGQMQLICQNSVFSHSNESQ